MKHIVRLIVVAIIIVGGGFLIFGLVNDNTPLNVSEYVIAQNEEIDKVEKNINLLKTNFKKDSVNFETYSRNAILFESLLKDFEYYENYLTSTTLTKTDENNIKKSFNNLRLNLTELDNVIKDLSSYIILEGADSEEIALLENKVNEKFNNVVIQSLNLSNVLANIVETKVYGGKCFDAGFNLLEIKNIMIKSFLEKGEGFNFVSGVNTKINDFFENKQKLNPEMKSLVILFNLYSNNDWLERFNEYFEHNEVVNNANISITDFNNMLNILMTEVYYEKV